MTLTYLNIYKAQIKQKLLNIQKKLSENNMKFDFSINDKNPLDEYFDVEVNDNKIYLFLKNSLSKFQ